MNEYAQKQIDAIAEACKRIKPLVAIRCITFNHEPYIRDALEGFVMQKTDFPFVAIVHDDASTDGTASIIREYAAKYPNIIFPIFETENQYSKGNDSLRRIVDGACYATEAKYIATCEGDDYWIDPNKLQKQVKILEEKPDVGAIYTDFESFNNETKEIIPHIFVPQSGWQYETMILEKLNIWTLTTCARTELRKTLPIVPNNYEMFKGDSFFFLHVTSKMKVIALPDKTARYRILKNSASHFTDSLKSAHFQYLLSNTHQWFLDNGPKICKKTRRDVFSKIGRRKIRYAILSNQPSIVKKFHFPMKYINSSKDILLYISCKLLKYRQIMKIVNKIIK